MHNLSKIQFVVIMLLTSALSNYCADHTSKTTEPIEDTCHFRLKTGKFDEDKVNEGLLNGSLQEINVNIRFQLSQIRQTPSI